MSHLTRSHGQVHASLVDPKSLILYNPSRTHRFWRRFCFCAVGDRQGEFFPYTCIVTTSNIHRADSTIRKDATGPRRTKVLIVDDEPAIREVLEMILQEWGYDVRLASDGAEAKEMVE